MVKRLSPARPRTLMGLAMLPKRDGTRKARETVQHLVASGPMRLVALLRFMMFWAGCSGAIRARMAGARKSQTGPR